MAAGLPRYSMILSMARMTRAAGNDKSASIVSPSRLKSSSTLVIGIELPGEPG
jgi:hypothetical protein